MTHCPPPIRVGQHQREPEVSPGHGVFEPGKPVRARRPARAAEVPASDRQRAVPPGKPRPQRKVRLRQGSSRGLYRRDPDLRRRGFAGHGEDRHRQHERASEAGRRARQPARSRCTRPAPACRHVRSHGCQAYNAQPRLLLFRSSEISVAPPALWSRPPSRWESAPYGLLSPLSILAIESTVVRMRGTLRPRRDGRRAYLSATTHGGAQGGAGVTT
jgi:hypothetical protein